jgi:hypothetical protein
MLPIRTIDDLVRLIYPKMPTKAGQRAIRDGVVHALGGFAAAEGFLPSWIVMVESRRGSQWIMQVQVDSDANRYRVRWLEDSADIPWGRWLGNSSKYRTRLWLGDGVARTMYNEWKDSNGRTSPDPFFVTAPAQAAHHPGGRYVRVDSPRVRHQDHPADSSELGSPRRRGPRQAQDRDEGEPPIHDSGVDS